MLIDGVLFAYRTAVHKSTGLTPYEVMFCRFIIMKVNTLCIVFNFRKAVLPIEAEFQPDSSTSFIDVEQTEEVVLKMKEIKDSIYHTAKGNIAKAQMKYKNDYDKKRGNGKVSINNKLS